MPAMLGALTVPVVYLIMWESGYSLPACLVATSLVLFDNAHIGQTRLILLDATLILSMALSVLCYIRFYKLRHMPFGRKWWKWLILTGVSLSCVISTKYVGVFTFFSIGVPVLIDLWALLDINRRQGVLSLPQFGRHFFARVLGFIVVPFLLYLFWFQVHFTILNRSGPGDDFMSPQFQETLSDNALTSSSVGIEFYDSIALKHKETKVFLHSHPEKYPLRYDDGRVSSQGQQVTGYPHNDSNNHWQLLPATEDVEAGTPIKNGDRVRLRHLVTDTLLLTHDVASPYYPTNQEFTTVSHEVANEKRFNDTIFELKFEGGKKKQNFKTLVTHFKLIHVPTRVAMWTHSKPLPDWGFKQAEINGNKNVQQSSNIWFASEVTSLPPDSERLSREPRKIKSLPFLRKWVELQRAMFFHNNALTSSHPYASHPISWPFLLRGVSFWTESKTRQQIYFLGNPTGWWLSSSLIAVFIGILGADQLALRRGMDALDKRKYFDIFFSVVTDTNVDQLTGTRSRLYNSTGFFFLAWVAHYIPFFIMGRQLFLHHYLPAHLASALVSGALVEFIFNVEPTHISSSTSSSSPDSPINSPTSLSPIRYSSISSDGTNPQTPLTPNYPNNHNESYSRSRHGSLLIPVRQRLANQSLVAVWSAAIAIIAVVAWSFVFFSPLTYGQPPLSVQQVLARKWLKYDFHFAK